MNVETANRLAGLRKARGLSQEEVAENIGVSAQAVSKWEIAESSPDADNLIALAKIYDMSIDDLVNPSEEMPQPKIKRKVKKRLEHLQDTWAAVGSLIAVIVFLLAGLLFHAWAIAWIVFLIVPIFYYIPVLKDRD